MKYGFDRRLEVIWSSDLQDLQIMNSPISESQIRAWDSEKAKQSADGVWTDANVAVLLRKLFRFIDGVERVAVFPTGSGPDAFGIDMAVYANGEPRPFQLKSSAAGLERHLEKAEVREIEVRPGHTIILDRVPCFWLSKPGPGNLVWLLEAISDFSQLPIKDSTLQEISQFRELAAALAETYPQNWVSKKLWKMVWKKDTSTLSTLSLIVEAGDRVILQP